MTPALNDDTPPMDSPAGAVPLTEAQEGLWYAQQLDPRNPIFNTGHCTGIRGEVDVERLASAIERTLAEADALSLAFIDTEDGPRQYFDAARRPVLERLTLPGDAAGRAEAERLMQADLRTPVDPRTTALHPFGRCRQIGQCPAHGAVVPARPPPGRRRLWHGADRAAGHAALPCAGRHTPDILCRRGGRRRALPRQCPACNRRCLLARTAGAAGHRRQPLRTQRRHGRSRAARRDRRARGRAAGPAPEGAADAGELARCADHAAGRLRAAPHRPAAGGARRTVDGPPGQRQRPQRGHRHEHRAAGAGHGPGPAAGRTHRPDRTPAEAGSTPRPLP